MMHAVGVVIIGRNEGERLRTCMQSLMEPGLNVVYVDSGSTDDSVDVVREQGFDVIELDMSQPFSAARARNEGYRHLILHYDQIDYIQFIDGDCELCSGWLLLAYEWLQKHTDLAAVCGRRRERYPDKTLYNRWCDIEWDTPIGPTNATGGDVMCRKQALMDVQGFSPHVIAGEEPEMCYRMRLHGWKIERLDAEMTLHDANMTHFSQWWKRCERSGHAYAQGFFLHGRGAEQYGQQDIIRILFWALFIPVVMVLGVSFFGVWACSLGLLYPVKVLQMTCRNRSGVGKGAALAYSASLMLGKFPQCKGAMTFFMRQLCGQHLTIIEYKK